MTPNDLTIDAASEIFKVDVNFYEGPVFAEWEDGVFALIFLDKNKSEIEQNNDFFHELCHPLRHCGRQDQLCLSCFKSCKRLQAAKFQLVAAMPMYLIQQVPTQRYWEHYINILAHEFRQPVARQRAGLIC